MLCFSHESRETLNDSRFWVMNLAEVIDKYGSENVTFQILPNDLIEAKANMDKIRRHTLFKIFGLHGRRNLSELGLFGAIQIWKLRSPRKDQGWGIIPC